MTVLNLRKTLLIVIILLSFLQTNLNSYNLDTKENRQLNHLNDLDMVDSDFNRSEYSFDDSSESNTCLSDRKVGYTEENIYLPGTLFNFSENIDLTQYYLVTDNETTVPDSLLLYYQINNPNNSIVANSTYDNYANDVINISTLHYTSLVILHTNNTFINPIISEFNCFGEVNQYNHNLQVNISFKLPKPIVELGYWNFKVVILKNQDDPLMSFTEKFLVIEDYTIKEGDLFIYNANQDNKWISIEALSVGKLSPGDNFTAIIFLYSDELVLINKSVFIHNYFVNYNIGVNSYSRNVTFYNSSIHSYLPPSENQEFGLVCNFKVPNTHFRGNFSLSISLGVPLEFGENNTLIRSHKISTNEIYASIDYGVYHEISDEIPNSIFIGDSFTPEITFHPVKIYNTSMKILPAFTIPEPKLHFYFDTSSTLEEKSLSWTLKAGDSNTILVNEYAIRVDRYGSKYSWKTGNYSMNFTWGSEDFKTFEYNNTSQHCINFKLREEFEFVGYDNGVSYLNPQRNVTLLTDKGDSQLDLELNIRFLPSGIVGSFSRDFTVFYNDSLFWAPTEIYGNKMIISLPNPFVYDFATKNQSFVLHARVLFSNMSETIIKGGITVKVILLEIGNGVSQTDYTMVFLAAISILLISISVGGVVFYLIFKKLDIPTQ